jgi:signal transduction histidine kinase
MKLRVEKLSSNGLNNAVTDGMLLDIARMEQMLGETLGYLRDDSRTETAVPVDLPSILQTVCTELADLGETISYGGPAKLVYRCKPSAMTRAVSNLVDNAVKFGATVSVSLSRLSDGGIQIDVADDGPGISYSHRSRVFEPFFKSDSSRRSGGEGFGLGLSIAKRIVESHGGRIELFDCAPRGLRVCISLPPQPAHAERVRHDA